MSADERIELLIAPDDAGERLDRVLAGKGTGLSRAEIQRLFAAERVEVEGKVAGVRDKARAGARVVLRPLPPPPSAAEPEDIPIEILFEDEQLIVIMKAAGMVVHPAAGHASGTLVNALRYHRDMSDVAEDSTERPGIVHRLDKDTSGVMVVAKTALAREALTAQFKTHDLEREYVAIACGTLKSSLTLDTLHGRHPRDRKKFSGKVARGKRAVTHVHVLERLHGTTLVRCTLETGRTHQIRMHLAEHGHAILGDALYGKKPSDARLAAAAEAIGRQALHARVLGFKHPTTNAPLRFVAEPPADFQRALAALR
jgi:23S rRNA pseudouridine1911/1915/1917 synthase